MIFKPIICLAFMVLINKSKGSDIVQKEQHLLDKNLQILRRDFNKLVENVEDFAEDFLKQIQEAGTLVGTANEDYNWQDDKTNTIKKTTERSHPTSFRPTIAAIPTKLKTKPRQYSELYTLPEKYMELTNEIPARRKRSIDPTSNNNFNGRQPPLNPPVENGQRPLAPIKSQFEQKFPAPMTEQRLPVAERKEEKENILGLQQNTKETQDNTGNKNNYKGEVCATKNQKEIEMEQQKLEELKGEVKKLNELVNLLKDQQKLIKVMDQGDVHLDNNEVDNDLHKDAIENSFLYKALKQLEDKRHEERIKKEQNENNGESIHQNEDMTDLKRNLKKTVKNLNETREMLMKEQEKEDMLEGELKRQNSELKFLKVMMENLYDKSNSFNQQPKHSVKDRELGRNSDLEVSDIDIDSILGAAHTPKPWPTAITHPSSSPNGQTANVETTFTDKNIKNNNNMIDTNLTSMQRFLKTLTPNRGNINGSERRTQPSRSEHVNESFASAGAISQNDDEPFATKLKELFKQVHKEYGTSHNPFHTFNREYEREFLANLTQSALIQMTKYDPDRSKKFGLDTRESDPTDNHQNNMHKLLSILSKQKAEDSNNHHLTREDEDHVKQSQISHNETGLSESARASGSSRMDDLELKLKLVDMLTSEGKSDDTDERLKRLNDAMQKLVRPEKKTDDDLTVEELMALIKDRQQTQKKPQDQLAKLFKSLNEKPQNKADDVDIQSELKQLQRAINSLRPKEESGINNFGLLDNRRGKDEAQDFQSMLNQIITQNGGNANAGLIAQSTLNLDGAGPNLDKNSFALNQQLLNQIMSSGPNSVAIQANAHRPALPGGSYPAGIQDLIKTYGASQYINSQPSFHAGQAYGPNPYFYGSNSDASGSNFYGPSPNNLYYDYGPTYDSSYGPANAYNSPGLDSYVLNFRPYGASPYNSGPQANSNSYGNGYNQQGYSSGYQKSGYGGPQGYGGNSYSPGHYSGGNYQPAAHYPPSTPNSIPYGPYSYGSGYQPPKNNYQAPISYPSYNQVPNGYQGKTDYSSVTTVPSYGAGASSSYKGNYGGKPTQEGLASYGNSLFQSPSGAGGNYKGYNYGSKGYSGPSLDQSYGTSQNSDQYKYGMISDLTQQIQNLENIITGLNRGADYSQTSYDKTAVAGLEQRIYELKGVINSLNQPSYYTPVPQQPYRPNTQTYGQTQPAAAYNQNPTTSYNPPQSSYGNSAPSAYSSKSQLTPTHGEYQQSVSDRHKYSPQAVSPQPSASNSYQQGSQSNYNSGNNPSPAQSNEPSSAPAQESYQSNPQEAPYQPYLAPPSVASYQPKESLGEDRRISHAGRKGRSKHEEKDERGRKKRQVEAEGVLPMAARPEEEADLSIGLRQANNVGAKNPASYALGDDALTQMANTFKQYLEENLTQPQPSTNSQNRQSALEGLQQKLDALKIQLESQKPSARSLHDVFGPPAAYGLAPTSPASYGSPNNYYPPYYGANIVPQIPKSTKLTKKNDIFTEILIKILEKVLSSSPDVLSRLFGNLVTSVGDSYGDYYSPLQNILKNLGPVGYLPLILVKVIETLGTVFKYLKKNQFFKQFLLPGLILGLVGGAILFLMYFFQQDEPYGYISYQGKGDHNSYPQYEPDHYEHQYKSVTAPNYGNLRGRSDLTNYRSNFEMPGGSSYYGNPMGYNGNIRTYYDNPARFDSGNNDGSFANSPPLQYSRGYYDYFRDNNFQQSTKEN